MCLIVSFFDFIIIYIYIYIYAVRRIRSTARATSAPSFRPRRSPTRSVCVSQDYVLPLRYATRMEGACLGIGAMTTVSFAAPYTLANRMTPVALPRRADEHSALADGKLRVSACMLPKGYEGTRT